MQDPFIDKLEGVYSTAKKSGIHFDVKIRVGDTVHWAKIFRISQPNFFENSKLHLKWCSPLIIQGLKGIV
jgi:hypothetical protein